MTATEITETEQEDPVNERLHPLLQRLPGMVDIDKQERKLRRTMEFRSEVWRKANETYERAVARYKARCAEADEALKPHPKKNYGKEPDLLERQRELVGFRNQLDEIAQDRLRLIADNAETIVAQLLDLEADVLSESAAAVAVLDAAAPQLQELRDVMRTTNGAANRPIRTGGGRIGSFDVLNAVTNGDSFLQPSGNEIETTDFGGGMKITKRRRAKKTDDPTVERMEINHGGKRYPTNQTAPVQGGTGPVARKR